jgi:hypothetical protein
MSKCKIRAEHYNYIAERVCPLDTQEARLIYAQGGFNSRRYRWDLLYLGVPSKWIVDNIYKYAHDEHIDTVLRQLVPDLEVPTPVQLKLRAVQQILMTMRANGVTAEEIAAVSLSTDIDTFRKETGSTASPNELFDEYRDNEGFETFTGLVEEKYKELFLPDYK